MSDNAGYPCESCAELEQRIAELERDRRIRKQDAATIRTLQQEVERLQGIISDERCKSELLSEQACDLARAEGRAEVTEHLASLLREWDSLVSGIRSLDNTEKEASDGS